MATKRVELTTGTGGYDLTFKWQGGPYIDVYFGGGGGTPFEVVNVYDYAKGETVIPFKQSAMREHCRDWVADMRDELPCYWKNARY